MEKFIELIKKWNMLSGNYYSFDNFCDSEIDDECQKYEVRLVKCGYESNEHRWFTIDTNIYTLRMDGEDYYFGVTEVGTLKSEMMSRSDTGIEIYFTPMETYTTVGFKPIKGWEG